MTPEMFVSREEYCSTEIFNEWFKPQRAEAMMGSKLLIEGPVSMFLALMGPYSNGDFEETEIRLFAALISHLQRAVQLQPRLTGLEGPSEGSAAILNRLAQGVLLVDAGARVLLRTRLLNSCFEPVAVCFLDLRVSASKAPEKRDACARLSPIASIRAVRLAARAAAFGFPVGTERP
jgi:hypothetical protein